MLASGVDADARRRACELLLHEAGGGLLFGLVLGYLTFRLLSAASTTTRSKCC